MCSKKYRNVIKLLFSIIVWLIFIASYPPTITMEYIINRAIMWLWLTYPGSSYVSGL